jgi:hypothetical protein
MVLLLFTSIWMSFASEKLVRKISRNGKPQSMQVETPGQAGAQHAATSPGIRRIVHVISWRESWERSGFAVWIGNGNSILASIQSGCSDF